ncbi:cytochrome P450 [Burkholderia territorii]|uniref:cytochrome P450 n=1 Tax=Burkholderia territorii TaxID=1503055 RepID=UPI00075527CB|nr:cytochrome P450 [Burkholderia territorii]KWA04470.1 cytochrome P450 [Burkholderia territorii]
MLLNPLSRRVRMLQGMPVLPGAFPVVGHLPAVARALPDLLSYGERHWGTHFWLDMGAMGRMLVCTRPDAFDLFNNKDVLADLLSDVAPAMRDTMATQDGELHRRTRAWANPSFQPQGLSAAKVGELFADVMMSWIREWPARGPIDLVDETSALTLTMIFRMLGIAEDDIATWETHYRHYALVSLLPVDLPGTPQRRSRRAQAWIDARLRALVDERRRNAGDSGLLATLVRSPAAPDASSPESNLLGNLRALIHAAHKTTAVTMAHLVIRLTEYPDHWNALVAEARAAGAVPRNPSELARFPFAEALFLETLRTEPAFPLVFRRTRERIELGGRELAAGTRLIIPLILLSRAPSLYPQPDAFLPQRWLEHHGTHKPIQTLQFGSGPHRCLGFHTACMQLVQFAVTLALVLDERNLRPQLVPPRTGGRRRFPINYPSRQTQVAFRSVSSKDDTLPEIPS